MATLYKLKKDIAGYNGWGLAFSDIKFSATLAAATDVTLTVPTSAAIGAPLNSINKFLAIVQATSGNSVWCAVNETAAIPVGGTFASTRSELIVGGQYYAREVKAGDVMHFITNTAATDISVVFYALPAS